MMAIGRQAPLKTAHLIAVGSSKQAFYIIWIEQDKQGFRVCKASGAGERVWHRQAWECDSLAAAEALLQKRLREKTNPARPGVPGGSMVWDGFCSRLQAATNWKTQYFRVCRFP